MVGSDQMPSKDINQHNPAADRSDIDRLKALRKRLGMTWRGFYAWCVPILEERAEGVVVRSADDEQAHKHN